MDNSSYTSMDNLSNSFYVSPLSGPSFLAFNVAMLVAVVLPVITANTVILVALVLDSSTVKVVRLVLGSIRKQLCYWLHCCMLKKRKEQQMREQRATLWKGAAATMLLRRL